MYSKHRRLHNIQECKILPKVFLHQDRNRLTLLVLFTLRSTATCLQCHTHLNDPHLRQPCWTLQSILAIVALSSRTSREAVLFLMEVLFIVVNYPVMPTSDVVLFR